jgi:Fis family transcriptional regulator, factor for inversion stimulation protein
MPHLELNSTAQPEGEFAVKEQLEKLVLQMYRSGIRYSEAVREFQSVFIITVLRDQKANQSRAAQKLGMHRNTLRRVIRKLELDIRLSRPSTRRPPLGERPISVEKKARAT